MEHDDAGSIKLLNAINFAAIKHSEQRRKDSKKTPYINHPIGVAHMIATIGKVTDEHVLCAAVLHDTVEDTATTFDELEREFGPEVMTIVKECTDDKSLSKAERKRLQAENAPHKSHKAKLVKLGDKLYNLRDLQKSSPEEWSLQRVQEYFIWAKSVVDGVRGTNADLEAELDKVFIGELTYDGKTYPCIPKKD